MKPATPLAASSAPRANLLSVFPEGLTSRLFGEAQHRKLAADEVL